MVKTVRPGHTKGGKVQKGRLSQRQSLEYSFSTDSPTRQMRRCLVSPHPPPVKQHFDQWSNISHPPPRFRPDSHRDSALAPSLAPLLQADPERLVATTSIRTRLAPRFLLSSALDFGQGRPHCPSRLHGPRPARPLVPAMMASLSCIVYMLKQVGMSLSSTKSLPSGSPSHFSSAPASTESKAEKKME